MPGFRLALHDPVPFVSSDRGTTQGGFFKEAAWTNYPQWVYCLVPGVLTPVTVAYISIVTPSTQENNSSSFPLYQFM
jgi:hypothetical protein